MSDSGAGCSSSTPNEEHSTVSSIFSARNCSNATETETSLEKKSTRDNSSIEKIDKIEVPQSENQIESEDAETRELEKNSETIVLDTNIDLLGSASDTEFVENPYEIQRACDPAYESRKRKCSLASSASFSDENNDPRKRRVKCLQYLGLFVCAVGLTIFVIYYGWEHEEVRGFGGLSIARREGGSVNKVIEETITEILLKSPKPEEREKKIDGSLEPINHKFNN